MSNSHPLNNPTFKKPLFIFLDLIIIFIFFKMLRKSLKLIFSCFKSKMGNHFGHKNHQVQQTLTQDEIELLMTSTNMDKEQIRNFHTCFLMDCPAGVVTKKEFTKMFKQLHSNDVQKQKAEKFTEYVFK